LSRSAGVGARRRNPERSRGISEGSRGCMLHNAASGSSLDKYQNNDLKATITLRPDRHRVAQPPSAVALAFSHPTLHPHAIQVSGHEFTRAVRLKKSPFLSAEGRRAAQRSAKTEESCRPAARKPCGFSSRIAPARQKKEDTRPERRVSGLLRCCLSAARREIIEPTPGPPGTRDFRVMGWEGEAEKGG
jgi:hypothetical protein